METSWFLLNAKNPRPISPNQLGEEPILLTLTYRDLYSNEYFMAFHDHNLAKARLLGAVGE